MNNVNHEANFMNDLVYAKIKSNSNVTMFEWDVSRNRYLSDVVETGWQGYCMAVFHIIGEVL